MILTNANHHLHGNFAPNEALGICLLREPNGIPDVMLIANASEQQPLITAANILSVQGYTARIAIVYDIPLFLQQSETYQSSIFSGQPNVCIGMIEQAEANAITHQPIHCIDPSAPAAKVASIALSLIKEQQKK